MRIRLTQIDGKLRSLALMKLAHWHRARGDEVRFTKHVERQRGEQIYDRVYGSAIRICDRQKWREGESPELDLLAILQRRHLLHLKKLDARRVRQHGLC